MDIDRVSQVIFGTWRHRTGGPLQRRKGRDSKSTADAAGEDYEVTMTSLCDSSESDEEARNKEEPDTRAVKLVLLNNEDENLDNVHLDLQV